MTKETLADSLDSLFAPMRIPETLEVAAREAGLVIVYGTHDGRMVFRGALTTEVDARGGRIVELTQRDIRHAAAWAVPAPTQQIQAVWNDGEGWTWRYETSMPHASFALLEKPDEPFCRGIVFALADIGRSVQPKTRLAPSALRLGSGKTPAPHDELVPALLTFAWQQEGLYSVHGMLVPAVGDYVVLPRITSTTFGDLDTPTRWRVQAVEWTYPWEEGRGALRPEVDIHLARLRCFEWQHRHEPTGYVYLPPIASREEEGA